MEILIFVAAAIGFAAWGLVAIHRKGVANFWRHLAETNQTHGTDFGTSPASLATVVGVDLNNGGVLAFDQKNRKIAYLTKGGKSVEVLPYDFVRSWTVEWREQSSAGGARFGMVAVGTANARQNDVVLQIETNDLQRPILRMPMSSVRYARETSARLRTLLNNKK
ncbi:hypothetical protein [Duganella sacchari]|uniref:hypothetical protein n=1 Tax=Duganella sacchari TaxID=551987 RepID=UPI001114AE4F|nr:hypothetical protein [Duganella sacchari]